MGIAGGPDSGISQLIRSGMKLTASKKDFSPSARVENNHKVISLGSVTPQGLKHLIQYIYTGRFKISTENVISLAKAAKALKKGFSIEFKVLRKFSRHPD